MPRLHRSPFRGQVPRAGASRSRAGLTRSDAIVLAVLGVAAVGLGWLGLCIALTMVRPPGRALACKGQLKDLYNGAELYIMNHGDMRWHPLWLTQLADLSYCGALRDEADRVPSDPAYDWDGMEPLFRQSVLVCPLDRTQGRGGGRPDRLRDGDGQPIAQYPRADIDWHAGPPLAPGASAAEIQAANRVPTSYLYEFSTELCDRLYPTGAEQPVALASAEFAGASWASADVLRLCDSNGDGLVSWLEFRMLTVKGSKEVGLRAWGTRVPVLRCYHHAKGRRPGKDSRVITVTYGGDAVVGDDAWYRE